jgi:hypothetical protein
MALTASLLRALGQALSSAEKGAGPGTDAHARMALLEVGMGMGRLGLDRCVSVCWYLTPRDMITQQAYRQCLQGWAPTLLHELSPSPTTAPIALFPCFLEWAEAALLPLLNHTSSGDTAAALVPSAWAVYATVAERGGEALLALTGEGNENGAVSRGAASEARGR